MPYTNAVAPRANASAKAIPEAPAIINGSAYEAAAANAPNDVTTVAIAPIVMNMSAQSALALFLASTNLTMPYTNAVAPSASASASAIPVIPFLIRFSKFSAMIARPPNAVTMPVAVPITTSISSVETPPLFCTAASVIAPRTNPSAAAATRATLRRSLEPFDKSLLCFSTNLTSPTNPRVIELAIPNANVEYPINSGSFLNK